MNFATGSDKTILKFIFQIGVIMEKMLLHFLFKTLVGYKFEFCRMKEKGFNEWIEDVFYEKKLHVICGVGPSDPPKTLEEAETKFKVLVEKYNAAVVEYKKGTIKRKKKELNQDFKQN